MPHVLRLALLLLLPLLPPSAGAQTGPGGEPAPSDDWAGWIYLDGGGGDLPVRMRLGGGATLVDLPHLRRYGLEADRRSGSGGRWSVRLALGETPLRFVGDSVAPDRIRGRAEIGELEGTLWLHRSARPLHRGDAAPGEGCVGTFRFPSGRTVVLGRRAWGEPRYLDVATGRRGTLFATSDSTFFAGSAAYVPTAVTAEASCRTGSDGRAVLEWRPAGGEAETVAATPVAEREMTVRSGEVRLGATVLVPETGSPVPGLALLGGSGWTTRERVRDDAGILASAGVAVLIWDRRGYGASGGERVLPFDTTAADARAAMEALRGLPEVRGDAVGLAGRSRGGWPAALAAPDADFVLLLVPSGRPPADQETYRRIEALRATGVDGAGLLRARSYLELMYRWVETGTGWEAYRAALDDVWERGWFDVLGGSDTRRPEDWAWERMNAHFDPVPAWEEVEVPVLAIFAENDRSVETAVSLPRIGAALARAGNGSATLVMEPGVGHDLRTGPDLPPHMRPGYGPGVWSTVQEWLGRVTSVGSVGRTP